MMKKSISIIAITLLSSCATTYQPRSFTGGFSETQLDKNVFRVSFSVNAYTDSERAEDFALLRSAELTLKNGFTHFIIIDEKPISGHSTITPPTKSTTYTSISMIGNTANGVSTTTTEEETFVAKRKTKTIVLVNEKPEGYFAYDASLIHRTIREKYGLKTSQQ